MNVCTPQPSQPYQPISYENFVAPRNFQSFTCGHRIDSNEVFSGVGGGLSPQRSHSSESSSTHEGLAADPSHGLFMGRHPSVTPAVHRSFSFAPSRLQFQPSQPFLPPGSAFAVEEAHSLRHASEGHHREGPMPHPLRNASMSAAPWYAMLMGSPGAGVTSALQEGDAAEVEEVAHSPSPLSGSFLHGPPGAQGGAAAPQGGRGSTTVNHLTPSSADHPPVALSGTAETGPPSLHLFPPPFQEIRKPSHPPLNLSTSLLPREEGIRSTPIRAKEPSMVVSSTSEMLRGCTAEGLQDGGGGVVPPRSHGLRSPAVHSSLSEGLPLHGLLRSPTDPRDTSSYYSNMLREHPLPQRTSILNGIPRSVDSFHPDGSPSFASSEPASRRGNPRNINYAPVGPDHSFIEVFANFLLSQYAHFGATFCNFYSEAMNTFNFYTLRGVFISPSIAVPPLLPYMQAAAVSNRQQQQLLLASAMRKPSSGGPPHLVDGPAGFGPLLPNAAKSANRLHPKADPPPHRATRSHSNCRSGSSSSDEDYDSSREDHEKSCSSSAMDTSSDRSEERSPRRGPRHCEETQKGRKQKRETKRGYTKKKRIQSPKKKNKERQTKETYRSSTPRSHSPKSSIASFCEYHHQHQRQVGSENNFFSSGRANKAHQPVTPVGAAPSPEMYAIQENLNAVRQQLQYNSVETSALQQESAQMLRLIEEIRDDCLRGVEKDEQQQQQQRQLERQQETYRRPPPLVLHTARNNNKDRLSFLQPHPHHSRAKSSSLPLRSLPRVEHEHGHGVPSCEHGGEASSGKALLRQQQERLLDQKMEWLNELTHSGGGGTPLPHSRPEHALREELHVIRQLKADVQEVLHHLREAGTALEPRGADTKKAGPYAPPPGPGEGGSHRERRLLPPLKEKEREMKMRVSPDSSYNITGSPQTSASLPPPQQLFSRGASCAEVAPSCNSGFHTAPSDAWRSEGNGAWPQQHHQHNAVAAPSAFIPSPGSLPHYYAPSATSPPSNGRIEQLSLAPPAVPPLWAAGSGPPSGSVGLAAAPLVLMWPPPPYVHAAAPSLSLPLHPSAVAGPSPVPHGTTASSQSAERGLPAGDRHSPQRLVPRQTAKSKKRQGPPNPPQSDVCNSEGEKGKGEHPQQPTEAPHHLEMCRLKAKVLRLHEKMEEVSKDLYAML